MAWMALVSSMIWLEKQLLHGVIEFYQTVLSVKSTLLGQAQNEKVQQWTEASYAQNEEIKKISAWGGDLLRPHPDRHRIRHELRPHARIALGDRIPSRAARNGAVVGRPLLVVQTAQLAVGTWKVAASVHSGAISGDQACS